MLCAFLFPFCLLPSPFFSSSSPPFFLEGARCISSAATVRAESVTKMVRSIKKKNFPSGRLKVGPKPAHLGPKSPKSDNRAATLGAVDEDVEGDVADAGEAAATADESVDETDAGDELDHIDDGDGEDEEEVTVEEVVLAAAEEIKGEGNVSVVSCPLTILSLSLSLSRATHCSNYLWIVVSLCLPHARLMLM